MLVLSVLLWIVLVVGTVGLALVYGLFFFLIYCFAQSALISHIKGTGVQITEEQFPDLHRQISSCCDKLGQHQQPDAYLMQMGGAFNAFATRFFGRDFLVLYSDVVEFLHRPRDRPHQAQAPQMVDRAAAGFDAAADRRRLLARPRIHLRPARPGRLRQPPQR
jgi:hypothetical protein